MDNDLISREALIKWIDDSVSQYYGTYSTDMLNMWGLFKDYLINNAPTVEERLKGKWIKPSNTSTKSYQRMCNRCHNIAYFCGNGNYPNCPYCLAEMEADSETDN